jgi:glycosyltransferase involved in cell wall biosynthesis
VAIIRAIGMPAYPGKPRLAIVTTVARADFCEPLEWLDEFEVWHFYGALAPDIRADRLNGRYVRFRNTCELLLGLLKLRPDIIQGSEPYDFPPGFRLSCAALLAAGLLRRPFYFPTFENIPPRIKYAQRRGLPVGIILDPLLRSFLSLYSRKCSAVFAGNEGAVRNLRDVHAPAVRIRRELYATWGVDLRLFVPDGPRASVMKGDNVILFVGRLVEQKGVRQLLQAFLLIRESQPDATLVFIGTGPLAEEIAEFARSHSIRDRVLLLGPVPNCDMPPYFRAAKVTAAPSVTMSWSAEQVGMVSIQSIACGTPVVTTRSGSIPEFIEDGISGLLVPERDPEALAGAVLRLLQDDRLRQSLADTGRAYAERRYDAAGNVAKVQKILLQLLPHTRAQTS